MLRKYLVWPTILSLACVLLFADLAQAQRRGGWGGGRGGWGGGRGWGGSWGGIGVYVGPTYPNNYYRSGYYSPYRSGYYSPYRSSYYSPYWYDSYYYQPGTTYYSTPSVQYVQPAPPTAVAEGASIRVILPDPQAKVWFDDRLTAQQGTDRWFHTPAITATGTYRIRASWMVGGSEVVQERVVTVSPGQSFTVDFTR